MVRKCWARQLIAKERDMKRPDNLKVGDKFVLRRGMIGLPSGVTLTLYADDGSSCPKFSYESDSYVNDLGVRDIPLCYVYFHSLEPYTEQEDQQVDLSKYQPDTERLEVGKVYEFSCDGDEWFADTFDARWRDDNRQYESSLGYWTCVREVQAGSLGKIAPEPPVEGQAYMFEFAGLINEVFTGVFFGRHFTAVRYSELQKFDIEGCKNIRKLVPEG